MGKRNADKIEDSEEFRYIEENFDKIMKELEEETDLQDYRIPEEWDREFRKTIEETLMNEHKKKIRNVVKAVSLAACIVLITFVGLSVSTVKVQGFNITEVLGKIFQLNGKQYTTYSTVDIDMETEEEPQDIYFESKELSEVYKEIKTELKKPMFYLTYIPEDYVVENAVYNETYNVLSIDLTNEKDKVYILQQYHYDDMVVGTMNKDEEGIDVYNKNINQNITIYKSEQDNSFAFSMEVDHIFIAVRGEITVDECKKIAENVEFH